jgi:hypothetical protein
VKEPLRAVEPFSSDWQRMAMIVIQTPVKIGQSHTRYRSELSQEVRSHRCHSGSFCSERAFSVLPTVNGAAWMSRAMMQMLQLLQHSPGLTN